MNFTPFLRQTGIGSECDYVLEGVSLSFLIIKNKILLQNIACN
jgi:hypothetical protein